MIYESKIDFLGEDRPCEIYWDPIDGEVFINEVIIHFILEHGWRPNGKMEKWTEDFSADIKPILSDNQISDFARLIKEDAIKRASEDFHDSKLQDWQEKNRYSWV